MQPRTPSWLAWLRYLYTAPFQPDPTQIGKLTLPAQERQQRVALFRFIVINLTAIEALTLPVTILSRVGLLFTLAQSVSLGLCLVALLLNQFQKTTLASVLYVYGSAVLVLMNGYLNPGGLTIRAVLIYSLLTICIFLTGLLFPRAAIWPSALVMIAAATVSIALTTMPSDVAQSNPHVFVAGFLSVFYLATTTLTWIFAHSTSAGLAAMARAYQQEQELTTLKDHFIADANHELRTPIMSMYGNIDLLVKLGDKVQAEQRAAILQRALYSGDIVLRLLNSVLDTDVLEARAPSVTPQPVLLAPIVRALIETFDPRMVGEPGLEDASLLERDVTMQIPPDTLVFADEGRLKQILNNLISNALKYSPPGTPIRIVALTLPSAPTSQSMGGAMVQISIRDQGLGVPPAEMHNLFQRFVRLERDIAGPVRGTGVGLYLSRMLAEAMGGTMWIESRGIAGEGSTFSFTLPVPISDAPASDLPLAVAQPRTPEGKVQAGQLAPAFVVQDINDQPIALANYAGKKVLLAFFRSAACPLCGVRFWYLTQNYERLHAQGLQVIAIFESSRTVTLNYTERLQPPFPMIADPRKDLFRLYGVKSSPMRLAWGLLRRLPTYWEAWRRHVGGRIADGDLSLLPADMLIDGEGTVIRAYYGNDIGDHLPLREIERFLLAE